MKKEFCLMIIAVVTMFAASCSSTDSYFDDSSNSITNGGATGGISSSGESLSTGELATFSIGIDSTALSETETIPTDDEDYVENNTFTSEVYITFNGSSASVSNSVDGVTTTVSGAHVSVASTAKAVKYILSGYSADGSFKIQSSDKKFAIELNGLTLKNPSGAVINSQSGKRAYIILASGTFNQLTDGTSYDIPTGEDMKGTIFSEGELLFSGSGKLRIYANTKNGIASDDYILFRPGNNIYVKSAASNCIKSNEGIVVKGGVINCETSATASKGINTEGYYEQDGGRVTAITSGGGEYDSTESDCTGSAGVKSDSIFIMNGGALYCKSSGAGGKGISSDQAMTINDGTIKVICTGSTYSSGTASTSPKGIKSDANITINGGSTMIRTTAGEGSEGLESKATLHITAGTTEVYAYDDAINASKAINISGGYIYSYASNNDGIDSNGTLTISGGTAIAIGTTQPEDGFDCDNNTFTITGGTLLGLGGGTSTPSSSTCKQPVAIVGGSSLSSGSYLTLSSSDGSNIFAFKVPRSYSQYTLLFSNSSMSKGSSYTLKSGATASGSNDFNGYITGASVSGGSTLASLTLSSMVTTSNYSGSMGGGGTGGTGGGGARW
jgi:hypothetical protein